MDNFPSPSRCLQCPFGTISQGNGNENTCQCNLSGGFFIDSLDAGKCKICDSSCQTCDGTSSTCTSCQLDRVLMENKCLENCPNGFFKNENMNANINSECEKCGEYCTSCSSSSQCLKCTNNTFELISGKCSCP